MKTNAALTATFLLAASLGLAACSNTDQGNTPAGTSGEMATDNPGAMDSNQPGSDTWITTKVKAELATTDGVDSSELSINTVNGVVTMTGVLDNDVAVQKAIAAAQSIKGVTQVDSSGLKTR